MYVAILIISFILLLITKLIFKEINFIQLIMLLIIFVLGFYFIFKNPIFEQFEVDINNTKYTTIKPKIFNKNCPTTLIQKGPEFYLYNEKNAKIPGVNPLKFENLNEYVEFLNWQRSQGIECPILYFQETYDAQGNRVYKVRQSPTELNGGLQDLVFGTSNDGDPGNTIKGEALLLDGGVDDPPFNNNSFPGYDPDNQYIGLKTPLDDLYVSKSIVSRSLTNKTNNEAKFN